MKIKKEYKKMIGKELMPIMTSNRSVGMVYVRRLKKRDRIIF